MKISAVLTSFLVVACTANERNLEIRGMRNANSVDGESLSSTEEEYCEHWVGDDDWVLLTSHAFGVRSTDFTGDSDDACAMPYHNTSSPRGKVFLDNCNWESGGGWRLQTTEDCNSFILHPGDSPRQDEDPLCMQAGYGEPGRLAVSNRATIRLMPCDIDSPLQRFTMAEYNSWDDGNQWGSPIKLQAHPHLCLTWNGANDPVLGSTHLIVMPCGDLRKDRSEGWFWG